MKTEKKRILIVDDEEDITWAISKNLKNSNTNLEIECAHDGDTAYDLLNNQTFDLVVSDVRMPGRDGFQLMLDIRKKSPVTKIIIMTAYGSQDIMEKADTFGSYFYIEKPFDIGYLKQLVFDALEIDKTGFVGHIDKAGLGELIELNCSSKSNSQLTVTSQNGVGTIYFNNGNVIHAECGGLKSERAFYNILNWNTGTFRITRRGTNTQRSIFKDWKTLLHQCS